MLQEENSSGWASLSAGRLKSGPDALLTIFRPFRPPFAFSDPDLRPPISLPLPCRSFRAAAERERVVQTNFSLTENPISHCLTVFCSNLGFGANQSQ